MNQSHYLNAIEYLKHHGFSDLFFSQPEYPFIFNHIDRAIDVLSWVDQSILNREKIAFLPVLDDLFRIGTYEYRHGGLVDPFLHIYALAILFKYKKQIEECRLPVQDDVVFSYRLLQKDGPELFDPNIGWGKFNEISIDLAKQSITVGSVDIAGFYASIRPAHFEDIRFLETFSDDDQLRLNTILHHIDLEKYGLPVGSDFARILAELLLSQIDHDLKNAGLKYTRFVDDIRIFSENEKAMTRDIYHLTKVLNAHGLNPNRQKISVLNRDDFIERLKFKSASLMVDQTSQAAVINPLFDPYTEMVIGRVDDLKAMSKTQSLHDAIKFELEKVSADLTALKIIISALQYCPVIDAVMTIAEALNHLHRPEIQIVMLRLAKVIETRNGDFSLSDQETLSSQIEQLLMTEHQNLPLSVEALLLNARSVLKTDLGADFETLLSVSYHQTDHDHLKRNIYSLLVSHSNNKSIISHLMPAPQDTSPWLKTLQDVTWFKKTGQTPPSLPPSHPSPMQHLIAKMG